MISAWTSDVITALWRHRRTSRSFSLGMIAALASACQQEPARNGSGEIVPTGHFGETITYTMAFNKNSGSYKYDCKNDDQLEASYVLKIEVPVIVRTCQNYYTRADAVYAIYVHDGPFYESFIDRLDTQNLHLMHGFVVVEPRYSGSKERPWHVSARKAESRTFETSRNELLALIAHFRSIDRKFILVGDGYGGLIIASVLDQLRKEESVILYTPVLSTNEQGISDVIASNTDLKRDYTALCKAAIEPECGGSRQWILNNIYRRCSNFSPITQYAKSGFASKIWLVSGDGATTSGNADAKAFAAAFPKSVMMINIANLTRDGFTNINQFKQAEKFLAPVLALGNLKDNDK